MADSGKNAAFMYGGTTYDADDCLQGWDLSDAVQDIIYQCDGKDKHAAGTEAISFRTSLAIAATDTAKISALAPGGNSTQFNAWPGGNTTNYIEVTCTKAHIITRSMSAPMNGFIALDVEIGLDDATYSAA